MMSNVAFEYAKALFQLKDTKEEKKKFYNDLLETIEIFKDEEVYKFFIHPEIPKKVKKENIEQAYEKGDYRDFLMVLIDNDRLNIINEIKDEYYLLLLNQDKEKLVTVYSKNLLSESYLKELKNKLEKKYQTNIILKNEIDESIIAGIKIQVDSSLTDLTINSDFENLLSKLKE